MIEVFMLKIKELYWNSIIKSRDVLSFLVFWGGWDNGGLWECGKEGKSGSEGTPMWSDGLKKTNENRNMLHLMVMNEFLDLRRKKRGGFAQGRW